MEVMKCGVKLFRKIVSTKTDDTLSIYTYFSMAPVCTALLVCYYINGSFTTQTFSFTQICFYSNLSINFFEKVFVYLLRTMSLGRVNRKLGPKFRMEKAEQNV